MQRQYGLSRAIVGSACVALILAFAIIQAASFSLDADAAVPGALPRAVPKSFGLAVYGVLDRVAPAPYVESTLATNALAAGDVDDAERRVLRLPASPARDELLARVAIARHDDGLALEYFVAAPDFDAVQARVSALTATDPARAYALESALKLRLTTLGTHPDAVAEAAFRMGEISNVEHRYARGMDDFQTAVDLSPLSEKYLIGAANQALLLGDAARSDALFARAVDLDPASADAIAGRGVVALTRGDRTAAQRALLRARAIDPNSGMVLELERRLK